MSLTSKQGFAQSTDSEIFESGVHSRIAEKESYCKILYEGRVQSVTREQNFAPSPVL